GAEVWIAGEGMQVDLLKKEFPQLQYLPLKGYRIKYSRTRWGLLFSILRQIPVILKTIRNENHWLKKMIDRHG
ncbi:MAG TPA: glycosyl transferase family 28, partial [Chitinophagaceae bacterium]|nr:glycosyl transferase family 28 [Chitinophagaceae bacterium]